MSTRKKARKKSTSGKAKRSVAKRTPKAKTKVKRNPMAEYAATMQKQGVARVAYLSNDDTITNIRGRVSTGSIALDKALSNEMEPKGWAGIPLGRVTEIYGPPFVGKSTLLDSIFASVQRIGGIAVLADTEVSRDRSYTGRLGVDLEALNYLEFEGGDAYIENVIRAFIHSIEWWKTNYPDLPVVLGWDALGSTATSDEWSKGEEFGAKATQPGNAARAMNAASRQLPPRLAGTKIGLVIVNHEYVVIRTGFAARFGPKNETYGGSGVRHLDSLRIKLYSLGQSLKTSEGQIFGRVIGARLTKNRLGDPNQEIEVPILDGLGVSNIYTLLSDLKNRKVIVTAGGWSSVNIDGEVLKFQGWAGLREKCLADPTLYPRLLNVWEQGVNNANVSVSVSEVQSMCGA